MPEFANLLGRYWTTALIVVVFAIATGAALAAPEDSDLKFALAFGAGAALTALLDDLRAQAAETREVERTRRANDERRQDERNARILETNLRWLAETRRHFLLMTDWQTKKLADELTDTDVMPNVADYPGASLPLCGDARLVAAFRALTVAVHNHPRGEVASENMQDEFAAIRVAILGALDDQERRVLRGEEAAVVSPVDAAAANAGDDVISRVLRRADRLKKGEE
jgi:hypothetical protein